MFIANTVHEAKKQVKIWKNNNNTIGFVPTMGFLHDGHLSLIKQSVAKNHKTVVSIFVNPIQFSPNEDMDKYPRDFEADRAMCHNAEVDLIFYPKTDEMYPKDFSTYVDMDGLTKELCGKSRVNHFRGVCTVVTKLLNIIKADRAYFGQKDAQQLAVVRRMVRDLSMDVEIINCPTVREEDGLAKSSRNSYLSTAEREAAQVVSQAVFKGEYLVKVGEVNVLKVVEAMKAIIQAEPLAKIDYIEIVDLYAMDKIEKIKGSVLGAVAVYIGKTRLIDNFVCER